MDKCRLCGSYAVNPGHHGRPTFDERVDHDLCDVCFWSTRFQTAQAEIARLRAALAAIAKAMDGDTMIERHISDMALTALQPNINVDEHGSALRVYEYIMGI